jgi:2-polyprenyl-3-methyl-5-hydroxy-6-metoxy-1,4-benzoquinol methylase
MRYNKAIIYAYKRITLKEMSELTPIATKNECWVCSSVSLDIIKPSNINSTVKSESFAITDSSYGVTSELSQCRNCNFIQSTDLSDVLAFYQNLEDPSYEANRKERLLQAKKIITTIKKQKSDGRLLDIGAGSGILVQAAQEMGFSAQGVEPSEWLQKKATELNLPVELGTFPNDACNGPYDVITIIDVIEHVNNPLTLLQEAYKVLKKDGIIVVITPDVGSIAAKLLQYKWWHFRIAHIGYFTKKNLDLALTTANFKKVSMTRATWYFALDYLLQRVNVYLPSWGRLPQVAMFSKITIPLNLYDSLLAIYRKED